MHGKNKRCNSDNRYKARLHVITRTYRTSHPARQRNPSLLPWRFSLRVQRLNRSRCSQSIVIQFVGVKTLRMSKVPVKTQTSHRVLTAQQHIRGKHGDR